MVSGSTVSDISYTVPVGLVQWLDCNSSDGLVVRASASVAVDSDLVPSRVKPMTFNLICAVGKGT